MDFSANQKQRRPKANKAQKEYLVQYILDHPELKSNKFSNSFTYAKKKSMWDNLTIKLNKRGPEKNAKEWEKYWMDQRSKSKNDEAIRRKRNRMTGGGSPPTDCPSPTRQKILEIIGGDVVIEGEDVTEYGVNRSQSIPANVADVHFNETDDSVEDVFFEVDLPDSYSDKENEPDVMFETVGPSPTSVTTVSSVIKSPIARKSVINSPVARKSTKPKAVQTFAKRNNETAGSSSMTPILSSVVTNLFARKSTAPKTDHVPPSRNTEQKKDSVSTDKKKELKRKHTKQETEANENKMLMDLQRQQTEAVASMADSFKIIAATMSKNS
ncbi:uncharacterized protein LOC135844150 [Planococcus citri]|uniref:uncharacterized protein LOC135844150 n=1 Tax=Planococcus citri TaxID=170843 RepID=UPI0031FA303C